MSPRAGSFLYWAPRVAGIGATVFFAAFALDAFDGGSVHDVVPSFAVHLAPAALCAAGVLLAWRHPAVGAFLFALLAVGYAFSVPSRPDWIAAISGPLVLIALLFAISPRRLNAATKP